ncbi:hypothetical protein [Paenibacillus sp. PL91]|uniref:hypothetical protein n=1 Tax=Paenibacillus sp. PL91 TaxID=2729538 RepID=UPI00145E07E1|nr:hypothetical protein [Paenibacillus sp. PL91]MBC9199384.1 hypothetical protein [Paenibacillus sp. PL91]
MNKQKRMLLAVGLIVLLLALFRWNHFTTQTIAQVKVIEAKADEIVVEKMSGGRETVQIPKGIYKLIEVNREYWITYEHRKWERPTLISIEP